MRKMWLLTILSLAILATHSAFADTEKADKPVAPQGVSFTVVDAPPAEKADDEKKDPQPAEKPEEPQEEDQLLLEYDGVPFGDVLDELRAELNVLIICKDEKLLKRNLYHHSTVPRSMALATVCRSVMHTVHPAYILCTEDELIESDELPKVKSSKHVDFKLEDAELQTAIKYASEVTEVPLTFTTADAELKAVCEGKALPIGEAMEQIAKASECSVTTGYLLKFVDFGFIDEALKKIEDMPVEELDKMIREGLERAEQGGGAGGEGQGAAGPGRGGPPTEDQIRSGMQDGMKMFQELAPEERQFIVSKGVGILNRVAGITRKLSPDTQAKIKTRAQPALGVMVGGFLSLQPQTRSDLMPLMQALKGFGW